MDATLAPVWLGLLVAAGLSYPRRPRTAGALFVGLGILSLSLILRDSGNLAVAPVALFFVALGVWQIVRFRDPAVRARHVEQWTSQS